MGMLFTAAVNRTDLRYDLATGDISSLPSSQNPLVQLRARELLVMLQYVILSHVMLEYVMSFHAILCYLQYVMLCLICYVMLCCLMS